MVAAFDLINYGSAASGGTCPPEDTYVLEFKSYTQPVEKDDPFNPGKKKTEMTFRWEIVSVPPDFSEDERDEWMGHEFNTFVNLVKDLNNEKAVLGLILKALKPRTEPFGINERVQLPEYIGCKMKAFIKASPSGWPKISNFAPATRRPTAAQRPAPEKPFDFNRVSSTPTPPPATAGDDGWE